jgi:hypothetical protein
MIMSRWLPLRARAAAAINILSPEPSMKSTLAKSISTLDPG